MPRVANPPHASARGNSKQPGGDKNTFHSSMKSRIVLNDDVQEKAVRLQSRQALHDVQMNQLKAAAASPIRRLHSHARAGSSSPKTTPRGGRSDDRNKENELPGAGLALFGGSGTSPVKRVPILANFEEWMKMATDNKINATNSWNFALIDYFHDLSLLKEGDGVNFQKASCTLDGCVKIYSSRVDSVATETGKLLSGLADSGNKKQRRHEGDGEDGHGAEDGGGSEDDEDDEKRKSKRKAQRSCEATLAPSFASLQLKKFELEFSVDPLFKKASADFDEGGAKGLLLNHLTIDAHGRVVFDSSDDTEDASGEGQERRRKDDVIDSEGTSELNNPKSRDGSVPPLGEDSTNVDEDIETDLATLGAKFFPDLSKLDRQDICPSLKNFDLGDPSGALDLPFLKSAEEDDLDEASCRGPIGDRSGVFLDDENPAGFDDDDDFDLPAGTGFGDGGAVWAKDAAKEHHVEDGGLDQEGVACDEGQAGVEASNYAPGSEDYVLSLDKRLGKAEGDHEDVLNYFDQALRKNWAGPEHWRIRRMKDMTKSTTPATKPRKEKEAFEVDFLSPLDQTVAESIYTPATSSATISLPKIQWKSKTRNLLPDDKHFNSRQLLQLFLKPKARLGSRRKMGIASKRQAEVPDREMDEAYWARREIDANADGEVPKGDYDANFFQDDGLAFAEGLPEEDDDDFADAREHFSPGVEGEPGIAGAQGIAEALASGSQDAAFGSQLVTQNRRLRPEYVQYARVAKKVDVRRLKEEMWKGMDLGMGIEKEPILPAPSTVQHPTASTTTDGSLRFTEVMNSLQTVYPKQAMADISTSYCFICLLHLANEKGLQIASEEHLTDLNIRIDRTAVITEGGG